jgi:hypothetical protein
MGAVVLGIGVGMGLGFTPGLRGCNSFLSNAVENGLH